MFAVGSTPNGRDYERPTEAARKELEDKRMHFELTYRDLKKAVIDLERENQILSKAAEDRLAENNRLALENCGLASKVKELEQTIAAISTVLDKEFSVVDRRSSDRDIIDDMGCFIEHHKNLERDKARLIETISKRCSYHHLPLVKGWAHSVNGKITRCRLEKEEIEAIDAANSKTGKERSDPTIQINRTGRVDGTKA